MPTSNSPDREESLKLIIDEQRRDHDYLIHIYDSLRSAENILLTAAFGVIAYLYYPVPDDKKMDIAQRFFVPTESYGQVIYFIAAAFFLYSIVKLTLTVFGDNPWETAYETPKNDYTHKHIDTLNYVKDRYDKCHEVNGAAYFKRKKGFTVLFFCILISAIILIVIKTLQ